ncbi:unnamed protein product [Allacma fusca]|uniref:Uncharacterized protein n=1 Tax=Allacma fusca TaxID=39272 RepID=A0A8J2JQT2_9HEXA|nr:unnamed protein product [Allacma fusca]
MLLFCFMLTFASTFGFEVDNQKNLTEDVGNELLSWSSPQNFTSLFPYYVSGCDYEDRPVIVIPCGKWDTVPIAVEGGENLYNLERRNYQIMERLKVGFFHTNCSADGTKESVLIYDYDGLELVSFTNTERNLIRI